MLRTTKDIWLEKKNGVCTTWVIFKPEEDNGFIPKGSEVELDSIYQDCVVCNVRLPFDYHERINNGTSLVKKTTCTAEFSLNDIQLLGRLDAVV